MINLEKFENKKILIALSGGPDSVFLLLNTFKKINSKNIICCHVNYNYRNDSINDQKICEKLCENLGIKLFIKNINQDYRKLNKNFEAWARTIRYEFFENIYKENDCDVIFTGHNLNDLCETFLIQKERKVITNYFGIKKETKINNCYVFRPMLNIKKSDIISFLSEQINKNKIEKYAVDCTNSDVRFLRNKIRMNLNEDDLEKIKNEITYLNNIQEKTAKKISNIILEKYFINLKDMKSNFNQIDIEKIIYSFLFKFGLKDKIISSKKNFIKEVVKQLYSEKSFIEFRIMNKIFIKDRDYFTFIPSDFDDVFECYIDDENKNKQIFMNWSTINKYKNNDYLITNNWRKYKNYKIGNRQMTLKEIYKKRKYSYVERFFNLLLIDYKKKNIKLLYSKNVNIYERNKHEQKI